MLPSNQGLLTWGFNTLWHLVANVCDRHSQRLESKKTVKNTETTKILISTCSALSGTSQESQESGLFQPAHGRPRGFSIAQQPSPVRPEPCGLVMPSSVFSSLAQGMTKKPVRWNHGPYSSETVRNMIIVFPKDNMNSGTLQKHSSDIFGHLEFIGISYLCIECAIPLSYLAFSVLHFVLMI